MRIWWSMAVLALPVAAMAVGFSITEENDLVLKKDNNYTQGMELRLTDVRFGTNSDARVSDWGWRSRMYTPKDISIAADQPGDRPWAGVTTVFNEWTGRSGENRLTEGLELGILGPEAACEWQQKTVHRLFGNRTPMGWSNQVPNEVSAQWYRTWWHDVAWVGDKDGLSADLLGSYGFVAGTTFDNVFAGTELRAGWNMPEEHPVSPIGPKLVRWREGFFAYLLADAQARYVLHNATLGHSFFRGDEEKWNRELVPVVGEAHYGVRAGWDRFSVSYLLGYRTKEFVGQPEPFEWGMVKLEFGIMF